MLDQGVLLEETLAAGDVSTYLTPSGATDEDAYERSASSDTAGWGSVEQVGPLGFVEVSETVTDDSLATELHDADDALEGAAEQSLTPLTDGAVEVAPKSKPWDVLDTVRRSRTRRTKRRTPTSSRRWTRRSREANRRCRETSVSRHASAFVGMRQDSCASPSI